MTSDPLRAALDEALERSARFRADLARLRYAAGIPGAIRASLPALAAAGLAAADPVHELAEHYAPVVTPAGPPLVRRLRYSALIALEAVRERLALKLAPWLADE